MQPFYGHYVSPMLARTLNQEPEDFVGTNFTACMPLLMATSKFRLKADTHYPSEQGMGHS